MTDIVARLRNMPWSGPVKPEILDAAADEIERLRAENVKDRTYLIEQERQLRARVAELERTTMPLGGWSSDS